MSQEPRGNDNDAPFARLDVQNSGTDQHGVPILASTQAITSSGQWFQGLTAAPAPSETVLGPTTAAVHPGLPQYQTASCNNATTAYTHGTQSAGYRGQPTEQLPMQASYADYVVHQLSIGDETVQIGITLNDTLICLWPDCPHQGISFRRKGCIKRHIVTQHLLPRAHWCRLCGRTFNRSDNLLSHCRRRHPESE